MPTILIVEDDYLIAEMLAMLLEDEGYRVVTAQHGAEGLDCLATASIDVVLCDIMMPVLDGPDFCRAMQAHPGFKNIPLIFMSAALETSVGNGCPYAAFLHKPVDLDTLLATINDALTKPS